MEENSSILKQFDSHFVRINEELEKVLDLCLPISRTRGTSESRNLKRSLTQTCPLFESIRFRPSAYPMGSVAARVGREVVNVRP